MCGAGGAAFGWAGVELVEAAGAGAGAGAGGGGGGSMAAHASSARACFSGVNAATQSDSKTTRKPKRRAASAVANTQVLVVTLHTTAATNQTNK